MKKTKFDTSIEGYKYIGINLTEEQHSDLMAINLMMNDSMENIPIHGIILTLKTLGLLPSEMINQESGNDSDENSYNDFKEDFQRKFGKIKE